MVIYGDNQVMINDTYTRDQNYLKNHYLQDPYDMNSQNQCSDNNSSTGTDDTNNSH